MRARRVVAAGAVASVALTLLQVTQVPVLAAESPAPARPTSATELVVRADVASAQQAAKALQTRVLVESETTETSRTFVEPNGSFTSELNSGVARVRRGERWLEVDTDLVRDGAGVRPAAAAGGLVLSGGGGSTSAPPQLVGLSAGGRSAGWVWPGALPEPVLSGPTARYVGSSYMRWV